MKVPFCVLSYSIVHYVSCDHLWREVRHVTREDGPSIPVSAPPATGVAFANVSVLVHSLV